MPRTEIGLLLLSVYAFLLYLQSHTLPKNKKKLANEIQQLVFRTCNCRLICSLDNQTLNFWPLLTYFVIWLMFQM